jgi:hypothetical protein
VVNRVWKRLIGAGFVEPAHDWEGHAASHPELLAWLGREFVAQGYNLRQLARLILTSQVYQRAATGRNLTAAPEQRFFAAPEARRLTAEQVVDALFAASGNAMEAEELTLDSDARRPADSFVSLGVPRRAWMLASLSNERDRPSLNLPRAQAVVDVLEAFGWTGSRQNPRTDREADPNVLQPGVLGNSPVSVWITRASQGSELADLALTATSAADGGGTRAAGAGADAGICGARAAGGRGRAGPFAAGAAGRIVGQPPRARCQHDQGRT